MTRNLRFSLLSNALDSLAQGIEFTLLYKNRPSRLKLAVLLLTQAVELTLKERLRREHWALIFAKVDQANKPNAHTVSLMEAKKRLEVIANLLFSQDDTNTIKNLAEIRNRIQHYEIDIPFEVVLSYVHSAIGFLVRFTKKELGEDIMDLLPSEQYQKLLEIESIYNDLEEVASKRIEELQRKLRPVRPKDLAIWDFNIIECPLCRNEFYVFSRSEHISECKFCGYKGGFVECARCGNVFPAGEDLEDKFYLCENCEAYLYHQ